MIRKSDYKDIYEIGNIWLESNLQAHNFISKEYWQSNLATVKDLLPLAEVYICEENNRIFGFIGLNGEYIEGIFVANKYRSMGIGKELINYVKSLKTQLSLKVYQKNRRAVLFYLREGFTVKDENIDKITQEKEYIMTWNRV